MHALDTMRMETGFLHWGHDISPEENQYQAGLSFAISYSKNVDFIGKDALSKIKDNPIDKRLMMFTFKDNKPGEPLLLHDEPIYLEDKIIGRTTSGNFSFCFNKNLSFGYVNSGKTTDSLKGEEIIYRGRKVKYPVNILEKPLNQKILEINFLQSTIKLFSNSHKCCIFTSYFNEGAAIDFISDN